MLGQNTVDLIARHALAMRQRPKVKDGELLARYLVDLCDVGECVARVVRIGLLVGDCRISWVDELDRCN